MRVEGAQHQWSHRHAELHCHWLLAALSSAKQAGQVLSGQVAQAREQQPRNGETAPPLSSASWQTRRDLGTGSRRGLWFKEKQLTVRTTSK